MTQQIGGGMARALQMTWFLMLLQQSFRLLHQALEACWAQLLQLLSFVALQLLSSVALGAISLVAAHPQAQPANPPSVRHLSLYS